MFVYARNMIDTKWKPRASDITWTQNMINMIKDGGTWAIPMNGSVWSVDKTNKVLTCKTGENDDMFFKVTKCCDAFGYTTALGTTVKSSTLASDLVETGNGRLNLKYSTNI